MIASRIFLASALFLLGTHSNAGERINGKYETVTESECNFTLVLRAKGHGSFIKSCRLEDGSHKDVLDKRKVKWKVHGSLVKVTGLDVPSGIFTIHQSLSCQSIGGTGSAFGLRGYEGNEFWKSPRKCK
jgi:hypothetical protein